MPKSAPITLPLGLQPLVERVALSYMSGPDTIDFAQPAGEPGLAGPESISWQVFRNPVSLFVGGVAAVILELAEPRVREGVWRHSSFRTDPVSRLQRTGLAAMVTVYGARSVAEAMIAGVVRAHDGVAGTTPDGQPYRANDPDLLTWVHATAAWGFLQAYLRFVDPLGPEARDMFYSEGIAAGHLYGVPQPPRSEAELTRLIDRTAPTLQPSQILFEFLGIMRRAPILPPGSAWLQPVLVRAAVDLLPGWARRQLRLGPGWNLRWSERRLLRSAARFAQRLRLDGSPAARACQRLGLPPDYLQAAWSGGER